MPHRCLRPALLAIGLFASLAANAQDAVVAFDIPAAPLDRMLNAMARQSDVQILFASDVASDRSAPRLTGRYRVGEALDRLLSGQGLEAVERSPGVFVVRRQAGAARPTSGTGKATTLGPVHVRGMRGYVATSSNSGKTDTPLLESPQSISVITREQMDAQNVQSVTQALRYVPGVRVETYGVDPKGYDWLNIRGFNAQATSDYKDGLRQLGSSYSFYRTEPYALERIDVVRGPSSSLFGLGDAGGIINRLSKLPAGRVREAMIQAGSHDRVQGQFDIGDEIDAEGRYRYRVVGLARDGNNQFKYTDGHEVEDRREYLAPSFTWTLDEDTHLTVQAEWLHDRSGGTVAVHTPRYGKAGSLLLGDHTFNRSEQRQHSLGYQFDHRFNEYAQFRQNLRYGEVDFMLDNLMPQGTLAQAGLVAASSPLAGYIIRQPRSFDEQLYTFEADNQLQLDFDTGGIAHTLLTGVDFTRSHVIVHRWNENLTASNLGYYWPLLFDPSKPRYGLAINRSTTAQFDYTQTQQQLGYYAQDQMRFGGHWIATAGARYDTVRMDTDNRLSRTASGRVDKHAFTGRAGLTYLTDAGLAPYVSYSESFMPNAGVASDQLALQPSKARQREVGIKYQAGEHLLLTAAWFDIGKTNVPSYTPSFVLTSEGRVQSRGVELEARAHWGESWDLLASYTHDDVEITRSANANKGNRPMLTPRDMASVWLGYRVQEGVLSGLGLGIGARRTGSTYGDDANLYKVGGYTLVDAGLTYRLNAYVSLGLNAQNLLDKRFVASCDAVNSCYPGESRSVLGNVRFNW